MDTQRRYRAPTAGETRVKLRTVLALATLSDEEFYHYEEEELSLITGLLTACFFEARVGRTLVESAKGENRWISHFDEEEA